MKSNRIMQSKIYRFLDYALRLILLNALAIIPSFSFFIIYASFNNNFDSRLVYLTMIPLILWLFPSIVACTDVIKQYETNETNTIFKDFFKSFFNNYLKSMFFTIVIVICAILLYNSFMFFMNYANKSSIYIVGLILSFSFIFAFLMIIANVPLVMAYFKGLRILEISKLACIMAFKDLLTNVLMVITIIIFIILDVAFYVLMAVAGIALPIFLVIKLSFKQYIKIYRKVENRENEGKKN